MKIKILDLELFKRVLKSNNSVKILGEGNHRLHSESCQGFGFQIQGWQKPCVIEADGTVSYDNYNGNWGNQKDLDTIVQRYTVEKTKMEARKKGYSIFEKIQKDGSVKLTIEVK
ncbi:MAG: hypothetical protein AABX59_02490 [Nanoarchaeota archaeon]